MAAVLRALAHVRPWGARVAARLPAVLDTLPGPAATTPLAHSAWRAPLPVLNSAAPGQLTPLAVTGAVRAMKVRSSLRLLCEHCRFGTLPQPERTLEG